MKKVFALLAFVSVFAFYACNNAAESTEETTEAPAPAESTEETTEAPAPAEAPEETTEAPAPAEAPAQ